MTTQAQAEEKCFFGLLLRQFNQDKQHMPFRVQEAPPLQAVGLFCSSSLMLATPYYISSHQAMPTP